MPQRPVFYSGKVKPSTGNDGSGEPVNRTSSRVVDECRISAKSAETLSLLRSDASSLARHHVKLPMQISRDGTGGMTQR